MAKIQNISEIHPTLGFTEFDVQEKYRKSFNESELVWGIQRSGFFNGRGKWAKGFENQMV